MFGYRRRIIGPFIRQYSSKSASNSVRGSMESAKKRPTVFSPFFYKIERLLLSLLALLSLFGAGSGCRRVFAATGGSTGGLVVVVVLQNHIPILVQTLAMCLRVWNVSNTAVGTVAVSTKKCGNIVNGNEFCSIRAIVDITAHVTRAELHLFHHGRGHKHFHQLEGEEKGRGLKKRKKRKKKNSSKP